jgi:hypothetical protein
MSEWIFHVYEREGKLSEKEFFMLKLKEENEESKTLDYRA